MLSFTNINCTNKNINIKENIETLYENVLDILDALNVTMKDIQDLMIYDEDGNKSCHGNIPEYITKNFTNIQKMVDMKNFISSAEEQCIQLFNYLIITGSREIKTYESLFSVKNDITSIKVCLEKIIQTNH
jgi:hypothetical protein